MESMELIMGIIELIFLIIGLVWDQTWALVTGFVFFIISSLFELAAISSS